MDKIKVVINELERNPQNIRYTRLCEICDFYFGEARQKGTSHRVYKMPWSGDPRVNIQDSKGKAKIYQVKQVINALKRLEVQSDD